jgi:hypothetical protein
MSPPLLASNATQRGHPLLWSGLYTGMVNDARVDGEASSVAGSPIMVAWVDPLI